MLAADLIPEGKCAIYTVGAGRLVLCIESVLHWGDELTQVRTYVGVEKTPTQTSNNTAAHLFTPMSNTTHHHDMT